MLRCLVREGMSKEEAVGESGMLSQAVAGRGKK
jgi:hypothetical protein